MSQLTRQRAGETMRVAHLLRKQQIGRIGRDWQLYVLLMHSTCERLIRLIFFFGYMVRLVLPGPPLDHHKKINEQCKTTSKGVVFHP